jgi:arginyl-tRNA--protein-N-Asp/Glu arginylyltransferase
VSFPPVIFEQEILTRAAPSEMDWRWSKGWRHFGSDFFRYSLSLHEDGTWHHIQPLRLVLADFQPNSRHRRILKKNADLTLEIGPAQVNDAREALFLRHRARFKTNIPESLRVFLPEASPSTEPCECRELRLLDPTGALLAVSFLDLGHESCSSVYAMFEPAAATRSLGICTFLHEIAYAQRTGRRYLYPGYATVEPSHYDYKKTFPALETYQWRTGAWLPLVPSP